MLAFIDDSGDPGFKIFQGSSQFFVISVITFEDELEAEKTAIAIKELKRKLFKREDVEFKFSKTERENRLEFLKTINPFNFKVRSLVINKNSIYSPKLRDDKNSFYSYAINLVLKHSDGQIINAKVKIDGSGDRAFRKNFLSYLRRQINSRHRKIMDNCKLVDSKNNVLIQMADMIAGAVRRSYDESKTDCKIYKACFSRHIQDEWQFGNKK